MSKQKPLHKKVLVNKEGITLNQQREKIRQAKEVARVEKIQKIESKIKSVSKSKFYCDKVFVKGIYFLYMNGVVVYVGMSTENVFERVVSHKKDPSKTFDSFTIKDCSGISDEDIALKEKMLIKQFRPKHNVIHNPNKKLPKKLTKVK